MSTVSNPNRNHHMTKRCGHGPSDICDYCLVAYDEHTSPRRGKRARGHELEGLYFVCAACPK